SWLEPASPRPACGAGKSGSCTKASMVCCATSLARWARCRSPKRVAEIVRLTQEPPPHEGTHWTLRAMAKVVGLAASTVQAIWKAHGLSPHRWRQFKLSNDPAFVEKLHDIVRLYVSPPSDAVVLSFDEKAQSQVLARTQPGRP